LTNKFKSKFERNLSTAFRKRRLQFEYEPRKFKFIQPEIKRTYTPDFWLPEVGTYVESKGKLTPEDRKKLIWWRSCNPEVPLVILFMRGRNPIRRGSGTTYLDWATENGFEAYEWEEGLKVLAERKKKK
jgi:hypothetical protein